SHHTTHPPPRPTLFPYTTLFRSIQPSASSPYSATQMTATPGGGPSAAATPVSTLVTAKSASKFGLLGRGLRGVPVPRAGPPRPRSEEHTSELQSRENLVCRLLLE